MNWGIRGAHVASELPVIIVLIEENSILPDHPSLCLCKGLFYSQLGVGDLICRFYYDSALPMIRISQQWLHSNDPLGINKNCMATICKSDWPVPGQISTISCFFIIMAIEHFINPPLEAISTLIMSGRLRWCLVALNKTIAFVMIYLKILLACFKR